MVLGLLTSAGSLIGVYIMGMAVLSPCPLLVNETSGAVLMVRIDFKVVLFYLMFDSYNKKNIFVCFTGFGMVLLHFHPFIRKGDDCCHSA